MIYLTKEDWNNLILSKLSKKESFMQQFAELFKLNTVFRYLPKIYILKQQLLRNKHIYY